MKQNGKAFLRGERGRIWLAAVLAVLALALAAGVFWQLHSTAVALTDESEAEQEEQELYIPDTEQESSEGVLNLGEIPAAEAPDSAEGGSAIESVGELPEETHTAYFQMEETSDAGTDGEQISPDSAEAAAEQTLQPGTDPASAGETVYQAEDGAVAVTVTAPDGALPDGAELSVTLRGEDSEGYDLADAVLEEITAALPMTISLDGTGSGELEPGFGMAVVDICFLLNGEEVEPDAPVTVSLDTSALIPEDVNPDTVVIHHIEERGEEPEAVLVADSSEGFDAGSMVAEFTVDSFSAFTILWTPASGHTDTITVNVYDLSNGNAELPASTTYSFADAQVSGSGTEEDPDDSDFVIQDLVDRLTLGSGSGDSNDYDGYQFQYATVTTDKATYGSAENPVSHIDLKYWKTTFIFDFLAYYHWSYQVIYQDGTKSETTSSTGSTISNVTVNLYYGRPTVTIDSHMHEDHSYTLTAQDSYFSGTPTYTWSMEETALGTLTQYPDGSCAFVWSEDAQSGDSVQITVTASYTGADGSTETATDTVTLTDGAVAGTIHVNYTRNNTTSNAANAHVAIHDAEEHEIFRGTTDSSGNLVVRDAEGNDILVSGETYYVDIEYSYNNNTDYGLNSFLDDSQGHLIPNSAARLKVVQDGATYTFTLTTSYSAYNHIDVEVDGIYTISVNGTRMEFTSYIDPDYVMTIELPDGEIVTATGTAQTGGEAGMEYRFTGSYSSQWDDWASAEYKTNPDTNTGYYETPLLGTFHISGYVLISHDEIDDYVDTGTLTREQADALFAGCQVILVDTHSQDAQIPVGYYYLVEYSEYNPQVNVCTASQGARGYDFEIDLSQALVYLTDQLIVEKYVVDEGGNFLYSSGYDALDPSEQASWREPVSAATDDTVFTFTLSRLYGGYLERTTLVSGQYYIFDDLEPGYYAIEETAVDGYVPVVWDGNSESWNPSGYVQYVDPEQKDEGEIVSVTFYNMKQQDYGTVTVTKTVEDLTGEGFDGKYYLVNLYTATETSGEGDTVTYSDFQPVSDLGTKGNTDLFLTNGDSTSFSLRDGTYFIKESDLIYESPSDSTGQEAGESVFWTKGYGGLERVTDETGTVYCKFQVAAKGSTSITVTNLFREETDADVQIRKTDEEGNALTGAAFTLQDSEGRYYKGYDESSGEQEWDMQEVILRVDQDGALMIRALSNGTYTLTEVTAPYGYNLLSEPILLTVTDGTVSGSGADVTGGLVTADPLAEEDVILLTVKNVSGAMLPFTGGMGTGAYTLGGLMILVLAAVCLVTIQKRKGGAVQSSRHE